MAGPRTQKIDSARTLITDDNARRVCIEALLNRHFETVPPTSYGSWAHNTMDGFARNSVEGEAGYFTVVFHYWSLSDTYHRVDLHFSRDGTPIQPTFNHFFGPQPYHIQECLNTLNLVAEGILPVKDGNQRPINPTWKSPVG